eukprot:444470_1
MARNAGYDYLFKFILVGKCGVGKSNIMTRFVNNEYEDGKSVTIGMDFRIKTLEIDDIKVKFQIWDTSGLEQQATIRCKYYRGADAIMIVYSLRDRASFYGVNDFLREIAKHSN